MIILLFAAGLISLFISSYLLGAKEEEDSKILKTIATMVIFGSTALLIIIGVNGISGDYAKTIKCKEYQVDKIENITVVNSDTTKTVHYIIHDIKR